MRKVSFITIVLSLICLVNGPIAWARKYKCCDTGCNCRSVCWKPDYAHPHIVEINFKNKSISKLPSGSVKSGDFVQIRVTDLNQQLYKVSINKSDTSYYKGVAFPQFPDIEMTGIAEMLGKLLPLSTQFADKELFKYTPLVVPDSQLSVTGRSIDSALYKVSEQLAVIYSEMQAAKFKIDSLNFDVETYLLHQLLIDVHAKETEMNLEKIEQRLVITKQKIKEAIINIDKQRINLSQISESGSKFLQWMKDSEVNKEFYQQVFTLLNTMDTTASKIYTSINAVSAASLLSRVVNANNNASSTFTSFPMMINGDATELDIAFIPKDTSWRLPTYTIPKLRLPIKPSFYIGAGTSFIYSSLRNESYSTLETQVDSTKKNYQLKKEGGLSGEIAIAALLHFGKKIGKSNWGYNMVIGPALSLTTVVRPRLTTGFGFSYGSKQMISANLLLVAGYESRLSTLYEPNKEYPSKPETPVISRLGVGWGVALGYIYKF